MAINIKLLVNTLHRIRQDLRDGVIKAETQAYMLKVFGNSESCDQLIHKLNSDNSLQLKGLYQQVRELHQKINRCLERESKLLDEISEARETITKLKEQVKTYKNVDSNINKDTTYRQRDYNPKKGPKNKFSFDGGTISPEVEQHLNDLKNKWNITT